MCIFLVLLKNLAIMNQIMSSDSRKASGVTVNTLEGGINFHCIRMNTMNVQE